MDARRPSRRTVRERIDPRLTASLFANYRSAIEAVLELVDNAVDARLPGEPMELDLTVHPGTLTLTAVGGHGMGPVALERDYLRWGASSKRAGERIGRYGQGGKAAIGHLGQRFTIIVSPRGEDRAYTFRDEAYRDRTRLRTYDLVEARKPVDPSLGYIRIEIGAVDKRIDPRKLAARLGEVYRPLIEAQELRLRVDRAPIVAPAWSIVERHAFAVRAGGRLVRGWYGLLPDPPPLDVVGGMRLYHLGRLIGPPEWFGHGGPAVHPGLARLIGEVELPHVPVTMNKSDVERDSPAWLAVEARLHRLLAPLVRRLSREEGPVISPTAVRTAEQVRRILARALRLLESGRLFESEVGLASTGSGGQLTLDSPNPEPQGAEPAGSDQDAEATADADSDEVDEGPAGASGEVDRPLRTAPAGPGSRSGAAEVVVRSLDPRLRSAMVVEGGVRRVIINARYPLFDVRKGDLWYQLETALREVCATIPEATVPEFERKVNELMLVSLALAERRRRSRRSRASAGQRPLDLGHG